MKRVPTYWIAAVGGIPGFTLMELLVVISVIAVLAALLLPALARARSAAHRTECLSRQNQWAVAFLEYTEDNEGWIPREGYHTDGQVFWNNWAQVQNGISRDVWYNALPLYLSIPPASSYALPSARLPFYEHASFFHCPSARFPRAADNVGYQIALFSMAMNSQLINPPAGPTVLLSTIQDPTRTVLFLDNLLDDETPVVVQQDKTNLGQPSAFANRFAGRRHGRAGNLAFADGHVQSLPGEKVVESKGMNAGFSILPPVDVVWELDGTQ
jgi:prepilin-type N-terminal cleavage/methylation domain-containing protein/prepilin-type processing-associated H-X9-DG protein